jgi:hypothetical protein
VNQSVLHSIDRPTKKVLEVVGRFEIDAGQIFGKDGAVEIRQHRALLQFGERFRQLAGQRVLNLHAALGGWEQDRIGSKIGDFWQRAASRLKGKW